MSFSHRELLHVVEGENSRTVRPNPASPPLSLHVRYFDFLSSLEAEVPFLLRRVRVKGAVLEWRQFADMCWWLRWSFTSGPQEHVRLGEESFLSFALPVPPVALWLGGDLHCGVLDKWQPEFAVSWPVKKNAGSLCIKSTIGDWLAASHDGVLSAENLNVVFRNPAYLVVETGADPTRLTGYTFVALDERVTVNGGYLNNGKNANASYKQNVSSPEGYLVIVHGVVVIKGPVLDLLSGRLFGNSGRSFWRVINVTSRNCRCSFTSYLLAAVPALHFPRHDLDQ